MMLRAWSSSHGLSFAMTFVLLGVVVVFRLMVKRKGGFLTLFMSQPKVQNGFYWPQDWLVPLEVFIYVTVTIYCQAIFSP